MAGTGNCMERHVNRRIKDFTCTMQHGGHTVHIDPSGLRWGQPDCPRGMKKVRKANGARNPTKPRSYWSDRPASQ